MNAPTVLKDPLKFVLDFAFTRHSIDFDPFFKSSFLKGYVNEIINNNGNPVYFIRFFELVKEDIEQIRLDKISYDLYKSQCFEQERPEGDALCSWDPCPCGGFGTVINRGQGYLYIPESAVEFRRDCLTNEEFQIKLNKMADNLTPINRIIFTDVPVLVCEKGIKELDIDTNIAQEDAKHWWETGLIPLRPSPKRK